MTSPWGGAGSLDEKMIADLREWRSRITPAPSEAERSAGHPYSVQLRLEEVDALLAAVDERDALKRELVDMPDDRFAPVPVSSVPFTAEIPAEVRERSGEPAMRTPGVCSRCGGRLYYSVPSHAWVHSGAVPENCVPRPTPKPIS